MFALVSKIPRVSPLAHVPPLHRHFSAKAIYSSFPATLHYYSPHRVSSLFDNKEAESRPDDLPTERVIVAKDGLVYPGVKNFALGQPVSNGAEFRPNTTPMQEFTRMLYDQYYLDVQDEGKQVEEPYMYTVSRGTPVPGNLLLIHEKLDWFSLQPMRGMSLDDLNRSLDEFYDKHAVKETADEWFDKHPFLETINRAKEDMWMEK